jgi:hypothetical protein
VVRRVTPYWRLERIGRQHRKVRLLRDVAQADDADAER